MHSGNRSLASTILKVTSTLLRLRIHQSNIQPRLVVSGSHTNIFFIPEPGKYKVVARTRTMPRVRPLKRWQSYLVWVIQEDQSSNGSHAKVIPKAVRFAIPRMGDGLPDFSFSGLKTAVTKHVRGQGCHLSKTAVNLHGNQRPRGEFPARCGAVAGSNHGEDCGRSIAPRR
jgi:hypothetical protein